MNEEVKTGEKTTGAKDVTLRSMVIAAIWIGVLMLARALWPTILGQEFGLTMKEIVISGFVMSAVFSPVYLSIILDKAKDIKTGG